MNKSESRPDKLQVVVRMTHFLKLFRTTIDRHTIFFFFELSITYIY